MRKTYGSENTQTVRLTSLYGPVEVWKVTGISTESQFAAHDFYNKFVEKYGIIHATTATQPVSLQVQYSSSIGEAYLVTSDNTSYGLFSWTQGDYQASEGYAWGFRSGAEPSNGSMTSEKIIAAAPIKKLYGSLNGDTKLIYQDYAP